MTRRLLHISLLPVGALWLAASPSLAATWEPVTDYGGSTNMVIYVPDNVDGSPGIVVALHSCGNQYEGDSQNYFKAEADQYGFIIIAPTNGTPDCWNANAGEDGEKPDIIRMVDWVIANRNADASRVFAGGASSGACMTIALLATHPDVFAGGAMMAGVPYGAWTGGNSCGVCSQAATPRSEEEWGNIVRSNAPSGFNGPWPRLQIWHGDADTTLLYGWASETEKQWKNVLGLTGEGTPGTGPSGWNRTEYTDGGTVVLQVNRGPGKDHYLPDDFPRSEMAKFFGLDQDAPVGTGGAGGTGGSDTGGQNTGGVSTGGVSTGGVSTGGVSTGGVSTGGVSTGGVSTGGVSTGGVSTGGVSTGGVSTGGVSAGGVSTGGAATGGATTGGAATGGATMGGATTGGAGTTTGGVPSGGTGPSVGGSMAGTGGAGVEAGGGDDDGGCSCSVPGSASQRGTWALLCAAAIGIALGRSRVRKAR